MPKTETLTPSPLAESVEPVRAPRSDSRLRRTAFSAAGQRHGRLTVVKLHEYRKYHAYWLCLCDCGNSIITKASRLKEGRVKSCGCLQYEQQCRVHLHNVTHGRSMLPIYKVWSSIKQRCHNPANPKFPYYGGRGIGMCDRWRNSFENFFADVGEAPEGMSIDRIDTNGDYEPTNVRWATRQTQQNNMRSNRLLTLNGTTQTLTQWASALRLNSRTLRSRVRYGWSDKDILTTPINHAISQGRHY